MLAVTTLLNQLSTKQQLIVETDLQSKVAYNSSTLSVFSSMLFGESKKEILENCALDYKNYPRKERPIYQAIIDFYGLKAETTRDQFLADVHFAIHDEDFNSDVEKVKKLEELFHQMKRYQLEEESAELLYALAQSSVGTPLHAVYDHLHNKYKSVAESNNEAYAAFEKLNQKLTDFLDENLKAHSIKDLIKVYREIRSIHRENENRVSECILNSAMLLLANYCGQTQLLKENKWTLSQLFETCKAQIELLPFGVERMFMKSIFDTNLKFAVLHNTIEVNTLAFQKLQVQEIRNESYNFGFNIQEKYQNNKKVKSEHLIASFVRSMNATTISLKQNSIFSSPHQI